MRSLVAVVLGVVSVACASGALESHPERVVLAVERLAEGEASVLLGVVRDPEAGRPLARALVILMCTCLPSQIEVVTDDRGVYKFGDLPAGKYTIQVLYKDANVARVVELAPQVRMRVDMWIDPRSSFIMT